MSQQKNKGAWVVFKALYHVLPVKCTLCPNTTKMTKYSVYTNMHGCRDCLQCFFNDLLIVPENEQHS